MKGVKLFAVLMLIVQAAHAQILEVFVWDQERNSGVEQVKLVLQANKKRMEGYSDVNGTCRFDSLTPGYYQLTASGGRMETVVVKEIEIAAGKLRKISIAMESNVRKLGEVLISDTEPGRRLPVPLGEIPLTREQTLRYPAMFFDPGRLAAAYPGVVTTDDGTNGMSIRGNNPASIRWRLEGVEIVNPNHLPNAGIFSDRPAAASGGVLMFSSQLLDNAALLNGAYPPGFGDAIGGTMDMNLRKGNRNETEFTAQASLVGLDLAAEGPLPKNRERSSFLANYRYSTVGLLGQLGVSFGGETISFQDFSFNLFHETKSGGRLSVFGMGGLSANRFNALADTATVKLWKELQNIDFVSKTGVLGASFWKSWNKRSSMKLAYAYSGQYNQREEQYSLNPAIGSDEQTREHKNSLNLQFTHRLSARWQMSEGAMVLQQQLSQIQGSSTTTLNNAIVQPWVNMRFRLASDRVELNTGLHFYVTEGSVVLPEPRFLMGFRPFAAHRISMCIANQHSRNSLFYMENEPASAWQSGLKYEYVPKNWRFSAEVFWQAIFNLPVLQAQGDKLLLYNAMPDRFIPDSALFYNGEALNRGLELAVQRLFDGHWFVNANLSLIRSSGRIGEEAAQSTRWDVGHIANLSFGKEWALKNKKSRNRFLGVNFRLVQAGAFLEREIDPLRSSELPGSTVYVANSSFLRQNPDYFRADLRVYLKKHLANRQNSTLSLDIQNVSNRQNVAYRFYDHYTKRVETKYQLGLIPNIAWKIEF